MNEIATELRTMAARLRELFPECSQIGLETTGHVTLHGAGDYAAVTTMMRRIGIGEREKRAFDGASESGDPWSLQRGEVGGIEFTGFCSGLPPSCRIETVTKSVPETAPTGRMVEVAERVVRCTGKKGVRNLWEARMSAKPARWDIPSQTWVEPIPLVCPKCKGSDISRYAGSCVGVASIFWRCADCSAAFESPVRERPQPEEEE